MYNFYTNLFTCYSKTVMFKKPKYPFKYMLEYDKSVLKIDLQTCR